MLCGQKKKKKKNNKKQKQYCNKFNKDFKNGLRQKEKKNSYKKKRQNRKLVLATSPISLDILTGSMEDHKGSCQDASVKAPSFSMTHSTVETLGRVSLLLCPSI